MYAVVIFFFPCVTGKKRTNLVKSGREVYAVAALVYSEGSLSRFELPVYLYAHITQFVGSVGAEASSNKALKIPDECNFGLECSIRR